MLSRLVITFLPRSKRLLISWLQSPSAVIFIYIYIFMGFPGGSAGKESACNAGDVGSIRGLGRSPGEGKGYPFQCSGLENSMDCIYSPWGRRVRQLSDFHFHVYIHGGSDGKESVSSAGDPGSISGWGRSPRGGNVNPLQCSCLEDPMDRGAWRAIVHGVAESDRTEQLTLLYVTSSRRYTPGRIWFSLQAPKSGWDFFLAPPAPLPEQRKFLRENSNLSSGEEAIHWSPQTSPHLIHAIYHHLRPPSPRKLAPSLFLLILLAGSGNFLLGKQIKSYICVHLGQQNPSHAQKIA